MLRWCNAKNKFYVCVLRRCLRVVVCHFDCESLHGCVCVREREREREREYVCGMKRVFELERKRETLFAKDKVANLEAKKEHSLENIFGKL